ncbi:MAG: LysR substrate-binding domain-containing protein [Hyphomicrobiaceae bacterium]
MSLRALRTLLAIAERGSFAAAARACHLTQSAVSMQMKALEAELGVVLFDRSVRPPALTQQALGLMRHAEDALASYERLLAKVRAEPEVAGTLRLGAVPSVMTGLMPRALALLAARYPGVHVAVTMGLSAELVDRLAAGQLDAAVVSELRRTPRGLVWHPFHEEPLVLIAPLDARGEDVVALLARYPFIRYTQQAWVGELIDDLLRRRRLAVREAMTLDTLEAVTAMVHHGLGVSIIPWRGAGAIMATPVRHIPLPGAPVHRVVGLLFRPGVATEPLASALLGELREVATAPPARRVAAKTRARRR